MRGRIRDVDTDGPPAPSSLTIHVHCHREHWFKQYRVTPSKEDGRFTILVRFCSGPFSVVIDSPGEYYTLVEGRRIRFDALSGKTNLKLDVPARVHWDRGMLMGSVTVTRQLASWRRGHVEWKEAARAAGRVIVRLGSGGGSVSGRCGADGKWRFSIPLDGIARRGPVDLTVSLVGERARSVEHRRVIVLGRAMLSIRTSRKYRHVGELLRLSGTVRVQPGGVDGVHIRVRRGKSVMARTHPDETGNWNLGVPLAGNPGHIKLVVEAHGPFLSSPVRKSVFVELLPPKGLGMREQVAGAILAGALLLLLGASAGGRRVLAALVGHLLRLLGAVVAFVRWRQVEGEGANRGLNRVGHRTLKGLIHPKHTIQGRVILGGMEEFGAPTARDAPVVTLKARPQAVCLRSEFTDSWSGLFEPKGDRKNTELASVGQRGHGSGAREKTGPCGPHDRMSENIENVAADLPPREEILTVRPGPQAVAVFGPWPLQKGTWEVTAEAGGYLSAKQIVRIPHRGQHDDMVLVLSALSGIVLRRFVEVLQGYGVRWDRDRRARTAAELSAELAPLLDPVEQGLLADLREILEQALYAESEPSLQDVSLAGILADRIATVRRAGVDLQRNGR